MPMTRQRAEFAYMNNATLRALGRNREEAIQKLMQMDESQVLSNVPAGSPVAGPPARQAAISAAMGGPEPKRVTPASPAPVRPGIPIMAPRPEARLTLPDDVRRMAMREQGGEPEPAPAPEPEVVAAPAPAPSAEKKSKYVSPARIAAREAERELGILNYNAKKMTDKGLPLSAEIEMAIDLAERKLFNLNAEANAEEAAVVDADREAIFARQEKRLAERGERVTREEKNALSDALIKGGLAMMNPQRGANFLAALSGGLGQGLETYDTAKARAAEQRARLGEFADQVAAQRIDALTQARAAAVAAIRRGDDVNEQTLRVANMTDAAIVNRGTRDARILVAESAARKAKTEADFAPAEAQSQIDYRSAMGAAAGTRATNAGAPSGGLGTKGAAPTLQALIREQTSYQRTINDPLASKADKEAARAALRDINFQIALVKRSMGLGAPSGALQAPGGGAPAATMRYVPGKGLQPVS